MPITSTTSDIGLVLAQKRRSLNLTQAEVATKAHVGRRFISEMEAGKPTVELRKVLAAIEALGLAITLGDAIPTVSLLDQIISSTLDSQP